MPTESFESFLIYTGQWNRTVSSALQLSGLLPSTRKLGISTFPLISRDVHMRFSKLNLTCSCFNGCSRPNCLFHLLKYPLMYINWCWIKNMPPIKGNRGDITLHFRSQSMRVRKTNMFSIGFLVLYLVVNGRDCLWKINDLRIYLKSCKFLSILTVLQNFSNIHCFSISLNVGFLCGLWK